MLVYVLRIEQHQSYTVTVMYFKGYCMDLLIAALVIFILITCLGLVLLFIVVIAYYFEVYETQNHIEDEFMEKYFRNKNKED